MPIANPTYKHFGFVVGGLEWCVYSIMDKIWSESELSKHGATNPFSMIGCHGPVISC